MEVLTICRPHPITRVGGWGSTTDADRAHSAKWKQGVTVVAIPVTQYGGGVGMWDCDEVEHEQDACADGDRVASIW